MFVVDGVRSHFGPPATISALARPLPDRTLFPRWAWIGLLGLMIVLLFSYLDVQAQTGEQGNPIYPLFYGLGILIALGGLYRSQRRGVWVDNDGIAWRGAVMTEHAQWNEVADLQLEEEVRHMRMNDAGVTAKYKLYPITVRVMAGSSRGTHKLPLTHRSTTEAKRNVDAMRRHSRFKLDLQDDVQTEEFGRLFD